MPGDKLLLLLERRTEETYFTCFTSTKVQILTPAEPPRRQAVAAARAAHRGVAGRLFPAAHCKHLVGACALRPCDGGAGNGADGAAGRGAVAGGCDSKRPAGISYISVYLLYWYLSGCDSKRPAGISYISVYLLYWYLSILALLVSQYQIPAGRFALQPPATAQ